MPPILEAGYFFDLKMVCAGYAYYVTYTAYEASKFVGREIRRPDIVDVKNFREAANVLGQSIYIIQTEAGYCQWLYKKGWAIVQESLVKSVMPQWLKSAECVKAATGIYTDVKIVSPSALKHWTKRMRRMHVLNRDNKACLKCGATENEGVRLTMQHVKPFSHGGETTAHNLVTLCEPCNQALGVEEVEELYKKAGLHFGYDPSVIAGQITREACYNAMDLSDNLMQTRCEIW